MEIRTFLEPISKERLEEAYWIDFGQVRIELHRIKNESTKFELELLDNTPDGNKLISYIQFYTETAEPVLDQDMVRWLCDNKRCCTRKGERSRIAVRNGLYIRPAYQRLGLATYVYRREEDAFREWGAQEVHSFASEDGRWTWTRPRFGYEIDDFQFQTLLQRYKEWQRSQGISPIHRPSALSEFPRQFLLSKYVSSLTLFKAL